MKALLSQAQGGSVPAFAKLLTALERSDASKALAIDALLNPPNAAFRLGITGPPGAGKSTLINALLARFQNQFKKIGVLAVDPTSPISNGAILGDRIRYAENIAQSNVFVRSMGTRGSLGGLSSSAYLLLRAFDACGFDLVLIETVGVGQAEVEVMHVADHVTLVLVPESGDSIQAMKAGILEVADSFIVNKSDRPGAEALKREIEASFALGESTKKAEVFLASALNGDGVEDFARFVTESPERKNIIKNRLEPKRLREEAKRILRASLERKADLLVEKIGIPADLRDVVNRTEHKN